MEPEPDVKAELNETPQPEAGGAKIKSPVDFEALREQARAIVAGGVEVREKLAALVAESARRTQASGQGLVDMVKSVVDGASAAAAGVVSDERYGVLKQTTDALGDGLSQAALSAKTALEEARARGQRFASEDLHSVGVNLMALKTMFVQTVVHAGRLVGSEISGQAGDLKQHAERTMERVGPSFDAAIRAAKDDPIKLGQESLSAGAALTRQAAGSLFQSMGRLLQGAGDRLKGQTPV